jgi:hypothetical protein
MSKSRFPYVVLAAMLIAEFAVQGAETRRGAKHQMIGAPRSGPPANQMTFGPTEDCPHASGTGQTAGSALASHGFASGIGVSEQRSCNVDIVMTKDLVSQVSYSGSLGGLQRAIAQWE